MLSYAPFADSFKRVAASSLNPLPQPCRVMTRMPYRGKDIGSRRQLTETVLSILRRGRENELSAVLPHIGLIRSPRFLSPLVKLLDSPRRGTQLLASIALGSLGGPVVVQPLLDLLTRPCTRQGRLCQSLQAAIICALGESGSRRGVEALERVFEMDEPGDRFTSRRRSLVVGAWGTLAQRGLRPALKLLLETSNCLDPGLREQAVTELGVAFWHDPAAIPAPVFDTLVAALADPARRVQEAAEAALLNLADLGCPKAEKLVRR